MPVDFSRKALKVKAIDFGFGLVIQPNSGNSELLFPGSIQITTALNPDTNDGASLGISGQAWSDLFLASGAVINFAAGDITLTHSSGDLALAGGTLTLPDSGLILNATTVTATGAEINKLDDSAVALAPGSGFSTYEAYGAGTFLNGTVYRTQIVMDLTGLVDSGTVNDIIGDSGGAANANFGQYTTALSGTLMGGFVTCIEAPAGGDPDIDIATSSVATGAQDADVTGLADYAALLTRGASWAAGDVVPFTALPTANYYFYLATGAGAAGGTYTAGKFLIELYGV